MSFIKVKPAFNNRITAPVKNSLLHKLKVPVLAATMLIGASAANKLQAQTPKQDLYRQTDTTLNDTTKLIMRDSTNSKDTVVYNADSLNSSNNKLKKSTLGLNTRGSAAEELYFKVMANVLDAGETPYSAIYQALNEQQRDNSFVDVSDQMDELLEGMKDYANDRKDEIEERMIQNGSISEFHYGTDNSKTGTIIQNINITGLNQKDGKNQNDSTDSVSVVNNNNFIGDVSYRMRATTDKSEVETNIHAGSDNVDIQLAGIYKTITTNEGNLSIALNGRETIEGSNTSLSAGTSVDYNKNDFSTGLYYFYNRLTDEQGINDRTSELEGYLKYKQNISLSAGFQDLDIVRHYGAELKLAGAKNLDDINMKLSGSVLADAGFYKFYGDGIDYFDVNNIKNFGVGVVGGAYFKTDDIMASLNGRASYNYMIGDSYDINSLKLSILGSFAKGNVAVSAMISMFKDIMEVSDRTATNMNLFTSVGFEIRDLLKGISPQISYSSTSINNSVKHFFNVTLKTSLEALKKSQK